MNNISFSDALRYSVIGVEPLIILYFSGKEDFVIKLMTDLGAVGLPLFAFAFGAIYYSVYKVTVHNWFIRPSHDLWNKKSYRNFFKTRYENVTHFDAEYFWYYLNVKKFKDRNDYLVNQSSLNHLGYQTSIMLIITSIFIKPDQNYNYITLWLFITGIILFICNWFYARFMEAYIYRLVFSLSTEKNKLDKYAAKFGFIPVQSE